jgi:hypothetical protein
MEMGEYIFGVPVAEIVVYVFGRVCIMKSVETRSMYRFVAQFQRKEQVRIGKG